MLEQAGSEITRGIDPALRERQKAARRRLSAKTNRQLAVLARSHSEEAAEAVEQERYQALAELESVEAEIRRHSPRFAALTRPKPLATAEIRSLLDPDTVLLEYALGEERSFVWVVDRESVRSFELPPRREVDAAVRRVYAQMSTLDSRARGSESDPAADLSRMLLGPIAHLLDRQRLAVVADGALHYLPFGALPAPSLGSEPGDFLLERHQVVYLPSASSLAAQRRELGERPRASDGVAVLADPVFGLGDPRLAVIEPAPGAELEEVPRRTALRDLSRLALTRHEAETIAALAPGKVMMATGFDADRPLLLDGTLRAYRYLHIATHGVIDSGHPELSGLVLSLFDQHGQPQDGFLRLHDVYNLDLGAELVVLSGCSTALGEEIRGEGLVGLTRGLMYARVPRVVASLWRVQDRVTAELMARFYRAMWQEGLSPAAALRAAQLSIMRERGWRDPYYWAAFVHQGDWR